MLLSNLFTLAASATLAAGASLQQVTNFGSNPTKIYMYIYVPDKLAANPAVIVAVWLSSSACWEQGCSGPQ